MRPTSTGHPAGHRQQPPRRRHHPPPWRLLEIRLRRLSSREEADLRSRDARLAQQVHAAFGIFYNMGQDCTAGSRVFVQRPVYDKVASFIAEPAPARRGGTADMIAAVIGDIVSAMPATSRSMLTSSRG